MRLVHYIPLTFLAGVHGFAIFAPYAAVAVAAHVLLRRRKRLLV